MGAQLIAVVDHEPTFLRLMGGVLRSYGYEMLALPDVAQAYELIKRDQPQAILLDTWLGGRDAGWDLLQVLRLDPDTSAIPLIILSSDQQDSVEEKFARMKDGSVSLMFKPFDPGELMKLINATLERHHA